MFKKILVPLDGSTRAERAISVAARLARARGGSVVLVRAMSFSSMYGPGLAFYPTVTPSMIIEEQEAEKHYLSHAASSPEVAGIPIETIHSQGDAASAILDAAEATQADLIVLCSHGRTGFTRWALGSVAEKVAHHASIPVLILREKGPVPSALHPDPTSPLRVLVPLDGSVLAKAALEPAAQLIAALSGSTQGTLHLVSVVSPRHVVRDIPVDAQEREQRCHRAKTYLEQTIRHIREGVITPGVSSLPITITCSTEMDEDIASALVRAAESGCESEGIGRCDLIAMATHGRDGLSRWAMGSVTDRVLHTTHLPLLIVRPKELIHPSSESLATVQGHH